MPLPRSLAHLKRKISEEEWAEGRQWAGGRTSKNKYRMPKSQRPDGTVSGSTKRLALRFYQVKTGHCLPSSGQRAGPPRSAGGAGTSFRLGSISSRSARSGRPQQKILWAEVRKEIGKWKSQWKVRDLLADGRCSRAVLDFLPPRMWESWNQPRMVRGARHLSGSFGSAESGKRRGGWRPRSWAKEEPLLFLPTPRAFIASTGEEE